MNAAQVRKVSLLPEDVDCFVFWTKDPANFLPRLDLLDSRGYCYYFQFTLTPYGRKLEPGMRDKREIARTFAELSERLGRERVVWRYDPIVLRRLYRTRLSPHRVCPAVRYACAVHRYGDGELLLTCS